MPGTILSIEANKGQEVSKGDTLANIRSNEDGKCYQISRQWKEFVLVLVKRDNVEKNQSLISSNKCSIGLYLFDFLIPHPTK